jgi:membrane protease YdiL (CAAX protease family)
MLLLFFILAFVFTWGFAAPTLIGLSDEYHTPFIVLAAFGPLLSAIIVIKKNKSHGGVVLWLKEILNPRGVVRWILVGVFLLPLGIGLLHYELYRALGGQPDFSEAWPWWAYPIGLTLTALLTGGNEEPGWRGFALPALVRRYHPILATLILGLIHSVWHLPFIKEYDTSFGMYLFNLIGLTFIMNWLYFKSQRCVIPVMFFHAATNIIYRFIPTPTDVLDGAGTYMLLRGIIYWTIAIVILITTRGRLGWREE